MSKEECMENQQQKVIPNTTPLTLFLLIIGFIDVSNWVILLGVNSSDLIWQLFYFLFRIILCLTIFFVLKHLITLTSGKKGLFIIYTLIFFSCFSFLGVLTALFLYKILADPVTQPARLYHIDYEVGKEALKEEKLEIQVYLEELCKVGPLIDGMTDEEKDIRVATILAMEQVDSEVTRQILISAKNDTSKEVQYYAHEALKKISNTFFSRIKELTNTIKTYKTPPYELYKELADLYAQFAEANIEHPVIVGLYWDKAIEIYEKLLELFSEKRNDILYQFIPALYYHKNYELCIAYCNGIEYRNELFEHVSSFKARALFAMRDIPGLKELARKIKNLGINSIFNPLGLVESKNW